ncbi:MAG: dihydrodipicolinate synthase family protein [Parvularculaceae bacterium]|nr:dihydrodipicolinate synthase family protein [Parvularculaceae bacterium]
MDRDSIDWRGYIPAITTPFNERFELDLQMLRDLLEWLNQEQMHGIVVAGTTGEWFSMSTEEKVALFRTTGETLRGKMSLIAGCNAFTANETISLASVAKESGFNGVLVTPPPYVRPSDEGVYAFYKDINDAVDIPVCIYNWPPGTGIDMGLELLERLCDLEMVVALKNSTGDSDKFYREARALHDRVRIFGLPMNEQGVRLLDDGVADGLMGSGAVLGRNQPMFFEEYWRGEVKSALRYGAMDRVIMNEWFDDNFIARFGSAQAIMKTALNLQGLPGGMPRRPILPLSDEETDLVRRSLESLKILEDYGEAKRL